MQSTINSSKLKMVLLTLVFVLCTLMVSLVMPNIKVEAKEKKLHHR